MKTPFPVLVLPRSLATAAVFATALFLTPAKAAGLDNTKVRAAETPFGDMIANALLKAAGADLALVNAGATKAQIASDLEPETLLDLVIYPAEKVALLSLTGAQVRDALEHSLGALPTPSNGFLQLAGIKVVFNPNAPKGRRVRSVTLTSTGKPLDDSAGYRVAAPLGLAKGGQGYFVVFGKSSLKKTLDVTVGQALESYLGTVKRTPTKPAGRLTPTGK